MQKFIRITAIVAVALMGLSLLLILISVPFQESIALYLTDGSLKGDRVMELLPMFPTIPFLFGCLRLCCIVALLLVCYSKKDSIYFEIIIFVCLLVVLPLINYAVTQDTVELMADKGATYVGANSIANVISDYCLIFSDWAQAIAYSVCGMSILSKRMSKKA